MIQSTQGHTHDFALIDLPKNNIAVYKAITGEEVFKSSVQKQLELKAGEKLVLLSHFVINS